MRVQLRLASVKRFLTPASLTFLAIPWLIFVVGWLKGYLATLCGLLILLALYQSVRKSGGLFGRAQDEPDTISIDGRAIILTALVASLLLGTSGIGGFGPQDTDWIKHNAILKDLVERPWPVVYQLEGQELPMVYYIAYYLPAAVVGKLCGWQLANMALLVWSFIGLFLAMSWFLVLVRRFSYAAVMLFMLFSGLDLIGELITRWIVIPLRPEVAPLLRWDHIENWSIGWQYSSNTTLLFWVPHQALSGWIATGVVLNSILGSDRRDRDLFIFGLVALWSPFVAVGLLPYLLAALLLKAGTWTQALRKYLTAPNLGGSVLLITAILYYAAKLGDMAPLEGGRIVHGFSLSFAPDPEATAIGLFLIVVLCVLEFGLFGILISPAVRDWDYRDRVIFIATLASLTLLPLYSVGEANDLVMRAFIPALFVLAIFLGRVLFSRSLPRFRQLALIILLIIGSVTPLIEIRRHISAIGESREFIQMPSAYQVRSIDQWRRETDLDATIMLQYLGSAETPFFQIFAKN